MARQGILLLFLTGFVSVIEGEVQCLNNDGEPVDWYIAYKRNRDYAFYYMDATNASSWEFVEEPTRLLDQLNQSTGHTLNQIYTYISKSKEEKNETDFLYGMYNDQVTKPIRGKKGSSVPSSFGHTKGVVAFDKDSGFWLVHSLPCFPKPASCKYCGAGKAPRFAQTLLCISVNTDSYMDLIGYQLRMNNANVYLQSYSKHFQGESKYSNMTAALEKLKPFRGDPSTSEVELSTLDGKTFRSFAKNADFGQDLYLNWLAPTLEDDLYVETWRRKNKKHRPKLIPSESNGQQWVYNVEYVRFPEIKNFIGEFKYTRDHSKWAVTKEKSAQTVCIGDINREPSQFHRGGGTVCVNDTNIWNVFKKMVVKIISPGGEAAAAGDEDDDDCDDDEDEEEGDDEGEDEEEKKKKEEEEKKETRKLGETARKRRKIS